MSSVVTGSAGLLGHCLVERLLARGETVRRIDVVGGPDTLAIDLRDAARLADAVAGADVVYHLAAAQRMKPQFQALSEDEIFTRNLDGVRNVLAAAERHRVRKVVWISSSGVYGIPQTVPATESHPTVPLGAYGRSKLEGEQLCREAVERGLDVTMLRPMSLFGPHMTGVFPLLFEWVRTNRPVYLLGSGRNRVQMSSAWDVADACLLAADSPESRGAILNIGSAPERVPTVRDQVAALIAHAGATSPIVCIPAALLRTAARTLNVFGWSPIVPEHYLLADSNFILDIGAARRVLGWEPRFDNIAMMNAAYDWYATADPTYRPPRRAALRLLDVAAPVVRALA